MRHRFLGITAASLIVCGGAFAEVSEQEAAQLGNQLTPLGGEMAGNADGSIPAWTPETPIPANFDPDSGSYPNPWPEDQPLYVLDQGNWQQYESQLSEGSKALFQRYAENGFQMRVYPTRRSYEVPEWFYANTAKNARIATLSDDGLKVNNSMPGTPFPLAKSGVEAVWNHMVRYNSPVNYTYDVYYVGSNGQPVLATTAEGSIIYPMFENPDQPVGDNAWAKLRIDYQAPPRRAGEKLLVHEPGADYSESKGRKAWQYLTGQRRVRLAPAVAFDTPNPAVAGTSTYDDAMIYNGSPERYDWALVGKREMLVPYNNYDFLFVHPIEEMLGEKFLNPEFIRWEKHRVWVVEGTLKEGARHLYGKRRLYLDEDSWSALSSDAYDMRGELWRVQFSYGAKLYDGNGFFGASGAYDLIQGIYNLNGKPRPGEFHKGAQYPDKHFTSSALSRGGLR